MQARDCLPWQTDRMVPPTGTMFSNLTDFLQSRHPGGCQVAILKHDPGAFLGSFLNHLQGNRALALAQGQGVKFGSSKALSKQISDHRVKM